MTPFTRVIVLLLVAWLVIDIGIGAVSAPVPNSVVLMYMAIVLVGVLIYASDEERKWDAFKRPINRTLVSDETKWLRRGLLVAVPVLVGFIAFDRTRPRVEAPIELRSIHPAPPTSISFRGRQMQLTGLENPLRTRGSLDEHRATGRRVYYRNCMPCHGDLLDGAGHFAHGFSPTPLSFVDPGTIAQVSESFVFWRIAKGGPGLPREGVPWNSAMPAWESFLTEDEIWAVIIFIYEQAGRLPRAQEAHGAAPGAPHD